MLGPALLTAVCSLAAEEAGVDCATFEASQLQCVIGNNAERGEHRAGYNGVFALHAAADDESAFVPFYAGLNLEHFFDARPRNPDGDIFFEPRRAPMTFTRIDNATAELHQPPTPFYGVESWTRFTLKPPYYIDMSFRCVPRKDDFVGGFFGVFWASYINAPIN
ncbi:MAG TPA: hypothetical protein ENN80_09955, partial [Candidatus Hydrogenedentes bacterium]|nr:hypothetical protein [Candidatus Hydrogenedentota bacterium]